MFGCSGSSLLHGFFCSCREWGLLSSCGTQASHCGGLSCGARALEHSGFGSSGSRAGEHRLVSCGPWAWLLHGTWDPSWSGIETQVSYTGRQTPHHGAAREALGHFSQCIFIYLFFNIFPTDLPISWSLDSVLIHSCTVSPLQTNELLSKNMLLSPICP